MSYLSAVRLHFAGQFIANVPTVDNKSDNYKRAAAGQPIIDKGFNENGTGAFNLKDCKVRSAFCKDGTLADKDVVVGMSIADSGQMPAAKMVDLDPEQQQAPMIYGLVIRLLDAAGNVILSGTMEPAVSNDLWTRSPEVGTNIYGLGAMFQSVITGLKWQNLSIDDKQQTLNGSKFLYQLHQLAPDDAELSIKFNLDLFRPQNLGRIVGTIGTRDSEEPRHFVCGRHMFAREKSKGKPERHLHHSVAVLDPVLRSVRVDLGNSLPTDRRGQLVNVGEVNLVYDRLDGNGNFIARVSLGSIDYIAGGNPVWYETFAGVAEIKIPTQDVFDEVRKFPIGITLPDGDLPAALALYEPPRGLHVGAETKVCRLDPCFAGADKDQIKMLATRYGEPLPDARIVLFFEPTVPASDTGLDFDRCVGTDATGWAAATLQAQKTAEERDFIDSALYELRYALEETLAPSLRYPFNLCDIISVLVWAPFEPEESQTTFAGTVKPIFQIYAVLFPAMKQILDLTDYNTVCAKQSQIVMALSLPIENAHKMPVSRNLSPSKCKVILDWFANTGSNGKPLP